MCGRGTNHKSWREIHDLLDIHSGHMDLVQESPRYNVAPTTDVLIVRQLNGGNVPTTARWGLVPPWAREMPKFPMINARDDKMRGVDSEGNPIDRVKSYWTPFSKGQRCIMILNAYYEWKKIEGQGKRAYCIKRGDFEPLPIAAIWETNERFKILSTTMITTEANGSLQDIHDRMPVILKRHDISTWLNPSRDEETVAETLGLMKPYDGNDLDHYPVSDFVNRVGNEGPKCVERVRTFFD